MPDIAEQKIWADGFRHGYAGFVLRPGSDSTYAAGYQVGRVLRDAHRQEVEQVLRQGRIGPDQTERAA